MIGGYSMTTAPKESHPSDPVIDLIGELMDAGVDEYGPLDDYNRDTYDKCERCGWDWHGLPNMVCPGAFGPEPLGARAGDESPAVNLDEATRLELIQGTCVPTDFGLSSYEANGVVYIGPGGGGAHGAVGGPCVLPGGGGHPGGDWRRIFTVPNDPPCDCPPEGHRATCHGAWHFDDSPGVGLFQQQPVGYGFSLDSSRPPDDGTTCHAEQFAELMRRSPGPLWTVEPGVRFPDPVRRARDALCHMAVVFVEQVIGVRISEDGLETAYERAQAELANLAERFSAAPRVYLLGHEEPDDEGQAMQRLHSTGDLDATEAGRECGRQFAAGATVCDPPSGNQAQEEDSGT
jgi:hypothetical protein